MQFMKIYFCLKKKKTDLFQSGLRSLRARSPLHVAAMCSAQFKIYGSGDSSPELYFEIFRQCSLCFLGDFASGTSKYSSHKIDSFDWIAGMIT
jgi:hypothetical protein